MGTIGVGSMDELMKKTIPGSIFRDQPLQLPEGIDEHSYHQRLREIADRNKLYKTYIGLGFYNSILPPVIQRNILENPGWYTSYTPYQAEISQGRLEALLNFQTMVMELTGMEIANASLLDESTAAAEAMIMLYNSQPKKASQELKSKYFVDEKVFPQTRALLITRAEPLGIELVFGNYLDFSPDPSMFGAFVQYPSADGEIRDYSGFIRNAHDNDLSVAVAADLMSLTLLTPPGETGADVVMGSSQRFGIPLFYGGPHAAFFATREKFKRHLPGRIIGVSVDTEDRPALRMALQTREQHIKRERATSNICTAQALLASMAGMYAVYHGPEGLKRIASNIHSGAAYLAEQLDKLGYRVVHRDFFDTLLIGLPDSLSSKDIRKIAEERQINFHYPDPQHVQLSTDETTFEEQLNQILEVFSVGVKKSIHFHDRVGNRIVFDRSFSRSSSFLLQETFQRYRSETEMMRYIHMLERRDLALNQSMISLGSCTMKLNAASQLMPVTWPEFGAIHPFVPIDQTEGYHQLIHELEQALSEITGFEAISFQPNSGASGEYTGLRVIQAYHSDRGEGHRDVALIPVSAHGTNPASAVMAGLEVQLVNCDDRGNIDTVHLKELAEKYGDRISSIMITYPSTHGVFEDNIREIVDVVHQHGGQVYMDGANMNAQVGLTSPAAVGADVCHLNLHKTFAIPHGGGGPGVGPIGVASHLVEYLPTHPLVETGGVKGISSISAAPYGSAGILPISHAYIQLLGAEGLTESTRVAIMNANYVAASLKDYYDILYTGSGGFVAHEMILDCRKFRNSAQISEADIAKRLMDYGFHAPTLSFPVHGTLMMEPTESESKEELDRFIEAMKDIHKEIMDIQEGNVKAEESVLRNSPHTAEILLEDDWDRSYSRKKAAFPLPWVSRNKFWTPVSRINDAFGDRNLVCSCEPMEAYREDLHAVD